VFHASQSLAELQHRQAQLKVFTQETTLYGRGIFRGVL
jgi:hypothetical protein